MKTRNPWTDKDIQLLIELRDKDLPTKEIANQLNKSISSIINKSSKLNLPKDPRFWTNEEDAILKKLIEVEGKTNQEAADILEKTFSSVMNRSQRLKLEHSNLNKKGNCIYKTYDWTTIQKEYNTGLSYPQMQEKFPYLNHSAFLWGAKNNKFKSRETAEQNKISFHNGRRPKKPVKKGFIGYREQCKFMFNVYHFPSKFNLQLLKEKGWYNSIKNKEGIARDHKYSVKQGFINNVDPFLISHPANCELMTSRDNSIKHTKCSITLEELKEQIANW